MSSPVPSEAEEDKSVTSAKQGKVRQKLQPGHNRDVWEASTTRRRGQRRTAMAKTNREFELVGEELYFTDKEIMELEQKWTSDVNDLAQRNILDDDDARNVVVDLLREIRKLRYMLESERTKNVPVN